MRALTLWRPWPWAILHAPGELAKRIENRPWKPWPSIINQTIALHAGKKWDEDGAGMILKKTGTHEWEAEDEPGWTAEGIVGTARVVGYFKWRDGMQVRDLAQQRWCFGPWCWELDQVKALPAPIPCRGMQGLWTVPAVVEARIRRAA